MMDVSLQQECPNIKSSILPPFDNIRVKTLICMLQSGTLPILFISLPKELGDADGSEQGFLFP